MSSDRKASRRDFLNVRDTARTLREAASQDPESPPSGNSSAAQTGQADVPSFLIEISRRAMATDFQIFLDAARQQQDTEPALNALSLVEELEDQMTVYREHSEIMDINRRAADRAVMVKARLYELLRTAVNLYDETGGAFDIATGPLSKLWGFYRRRGQFPDAVALQEVLGRVGTKWIELDDQNSTIRFRKRGIEINLNAMGKGYALDRCGERLADSGVRSYLIHGGQSSILARGSRHSTADGKPDASGWRVAVRHPLKRSQQLGEIILRDRALGTSGTGTQFFHHKGRRYGHILDPRTGQPAEGVYSTTVLAPRAALADALSTAFFVMGVEETERYCRKHPDLSAILVCPGKRTGSIELRTIGLGEDDWRPAG